MGAYDDELRGIDDYVKMWSKIRDNYKKTNTLGQGLNHFVNRIELLVDLIWNGDEDHDVYLDGMRQRERALYNEFENTNLQLFYYLKSSNLWNEIITNYDQNTIERLESIHNMQNIINNHPDPHHDLKSQCGFIAIYDYDFYHQSLEFWSVLKHDPKFENFSYQFNVVWNGDKTSFINWFNENYHPIINYCQNHIVTSSYKQSQDLTIWVTIEPSKSNNRSHQIWISCDGNKVAMVNGDTTNISEQSFIKLVSTQTYPIINTKWSFKIPTMLLSHKKDKVWDYPDLYLAVDPTWLETNKITYENKIYEKPEDGFTFAFEIKEYYQNDKDQLVRINQYWFDQSFTTYLTTTNNDNGQFQTLHIEELFWKISLKKIKLSDYN